MANPEISGIASQLIKEISTSPFNKKIITTLCPLYLLILFLIVIKIFVKKRK